MCLLGSRPHISRSCSVRRTRLKRLWRNVKRSLTVSTSWRPWSAPASIAFPEICTKYVNLLRLGPSTISELKLTPARAVGSFLRIVLQDIAAVSRLPALDPRAPLG